MNADDIAIFLRSNPKFFDQHPELLEKIHVPHPHGGRAIPLSERQTLALREKVKAAEGKLGELIRFGEENDAISEKVHRLAVAPLGGPQCGLAAGNPCVPWFGEAAEHVRSVALVPLGDASAFGLLALGSEDAQRFFPDMGTLYLRRIGELCAAAATARL